MRALSDSLYLFVVLSNLSTVLYLWTYWGRININVWILFYFYFYSFGIRVYVRTVHWASISNRFGHISRNWRIFRENYFIHSRSQKKKFRRVLPEISQKSLTLVRSRLQRKFIKVSTRRDVSFTKLLSLSCRRSRIDFLFDI